MPNLFLQLDGITGESLDEFHENEIELIGWNWQGGKEAAESITNDAPYDIGQGKSRSANTKVGDITVTKRCDLASVTLAQYCALGTPIPSGVITCRKYAALQGSGLEFVAYLVIKLNRVMIRSVHFDIQSGEKEGGEVTETVKLNFEQVEIEYLMQKNRGTPGGGVCFAWDIGKHKPPTG